MDQQIYSIRVYQAGEKVVIQASLWRRAAPGLPIRKWRLLTTSMPARRAEDPRTVLQAVLARLIEP